MIEREENVPEPEAPEPKRERSQSGRRRGASVSFHIRRSIGGGPAAARPGAGRPDRTAHRELCGSLIASDVRMEGSEGQFPGTDKLYATEKGENEQLRKCTTTLETYGKYRMQSAQMQCLRSMSRSSASCAQRLTPNNISLPESVKCSLKQ